MNTEARDEILNESMGVIVETGNLNITDLNFGFDETEILKNISFDLTTGEKLGLVGNLGSGKSSLIRNMIGYHLPKLGMVKIDGYDINNKRIEELTNGKDVTYEITSRKELLSKNLYFTNKEEEQ